MKTYTPMMEQYLSIKNANPDVILLYRLGDFYELFFDDALQASEILNIRLTARECGGGEKAPMCGVPYHSVDSYISRLVDFGLKVGICEQVSDPTGKGIVEREVVRVVSKGTILEGKGLHNDKNNFIALIYHDEKSKFCGISFCDITNGDLMCAKVKTNIIAINDELSKFLPSEILVEEGFPFIDEIEHKFNVKCYEVPKHNFEKSECEARLKQKLNVHNLNGYGIQNEKEMIIATGALVNYLIVTQKSSLKHINDLKIITNTDFLLLDSSTRRTLELTESLHTRTKKGSLFGVLDKTKTPIGARFMRRAIDNPLYDTNAIKLRHDTVEFFKNDILRTEELREYLSTVKDIERILGKLSFNQVNGQDLLNLSVSFQFLPAIKSLIGENTELLANIYNRFDTLQDVSSLISDTISEQSPVKTNEGGLIRRGFNEELDKLYEIKENGTDYILNLEQRTRKETGIKGLKIKYNKVLGYFFEVTKANESFVPDYFIQKQNLVGNSRYVTEELSELEQTIMSADEKIIQIEQEIFQKLKASLIDEISRIKGVSMLIALIDMLQSFGYVAYKNNYVKPTLTSTGDIKIVNGRHPVVEQISEGSFVSNDTLLDLDENNLLVITGPNMSGKSTYMRQVALIVIMAQIGCFVPCDSLMITPVDRVFTRVGASDDLASGQSTFMLEMNELANILNNATSNSLLILDEIGRGTSTYDGLSIAWSVLEFIAKDNGLHAKTLFATHYHELVELESRFNSIKNYYVSIAEDNDNVIFLHKIKRGYTCQSYGIHVAKIAGLPSSVIDRAKIILSSLENEKSETRMSKKSSYKLEKAEKNFLTEDEDRDIDLIINELSSIDINNLTPLVAFEKITELANKSKSLGK